ncbi:hypothetical protein LPJ56_003049 [Coemansia sp. RSA 2599]|nr:hypothetical protein LPJ56_003049 [Coemansia sp. RSA 2599]
MGYPLGIDISVVLNPLATLKAKVPRDFDDIGILDAQYCPIPLKYAKVHGVKSEYIDEIRQKLPNDNGSLLMVSKILEKRSPDTPSLQVGDVIIKLNGSLIKRIEQMACFYNQKSVEVTIVRDQEEMTLEIPTTTLSKHTTRKVVCWAGFFLQEPTPSMQQKSTTVPSQVFSFCKIIGSPCSDKTDEYNHYIIEIDHTPVKTLDDVVAIARRLKSSDAQSFNADVASNKTFSSGRMPGRDVKVRIVNMNGQEIVMSLRTNDHYFPAWQAVRGPAIEDTWKVEEL